MRLKCVTLWLSNSEMYQIYKKLFYIWWIPVLHWFFIAIIICLCEANWFQLNIEVHHYWSFAVSIMKGFSEGSSKSWLNSGCSAPPSPSFFPPYRSVHWPHLSRTLFFLMASCPAEPERLERIFKLAPKIILSNESNLLILSQVVWKRTEIPHW